MNNVSSQVKFYRLVTFVIRWSLLVMDKLFDNLNTASFALLKDAHCNECAALFSIHNDTIVLDGRPKLTFKTN